jgi:protein O-GlcNAc transferase
VRAGRRAASPFSFLGVSDNAADQLACARTRAGALRAPSAPLWSGERYEHDRIRVAYLSPDFREHAVSYLTAGLFEQHDRKRFEVVALSFGPDDGSPTRRRLAAAFDRFIDARGIDDREAAAMLRRLEIDIAVDLAGPMRDSRPGILALRPAPVQVNYLGYPGTTGEDCIDYIIADDFVIPEQSKVFYSEKVVWLPDTYQANDSKRPDPGPAPSRDDAGLPGDAFVFCCFCNSYKITPSTFDAWMRLLRRVDGSVLWLLQRNAATDANLRREARERGVAPERLIFAPHVAYAQYLARYAAADLFLDTFPFNAGTTASDALWAGLPVLTLPGESFASRMAGSLLRAAGVPELIAESDAAYEELAARLATDAQPLADIRRRLGRAPRASALFDTARFCRNLEAAYVAMWERRRRGEAPESFAVV